MISETVVKVDSIPDSSVGTSPMASRISDNSDGGLGCHRLAVLTKGDNQREQSLIGREMVLVELTDVGVDGLDMLAQPLSFGLQAA